MLASSCERHGFAWQVAPGLRPRLARLALHTAAAYVPSDVDAAWLAGYPDVMPRDFAAAAAAAVLLLAAARGCLGSGPASLALLRALDAVCKDGLGDGVAEAASDSKTKVLDPKPGPSVGSRAAASREGLGEGGLGAHAANSRPEPGPSGSNRAASSTDGVPTGAPDQGRLEPAEGPHARGRNAGGPSAGGSSARGVDVGGSRAGGPGQQAPKPGSRESLLQTPPPVLPPPPPPPQREEGVGGLGLGVGELEVLAACLGVDRKTLPPGSAAQQHALLASLLQVCLLHRHRGSAL